MDVKVTWNQRLSFEGTADSGYTMPLGTDPSVGGDADGFRPMELMALSLAGCTAMDVMSILQKKRQAVTAFEVRVHAGRATEHPKVITRAAIEYLVAGGGVEEEAVVRAIELSATKYCPAYAMLSQVLPIEMGYQIFEEEGGVQKMVRQGSYVVPATPA